jgi:hypothetical protein
MMRANVIEHIVPIVVELKATLERKHSPLLRLVMLYLKELMTDYKDEIQGEFPLSLPLSVFDFCFLFLGFVRQQPDTGWLQMCWLPIRSLPGRSSTICGASTSSNACAKPVRLDSFVLSLFLRSGAYCCLLFPLW